MFFYIIFVYVFSKDFKILKIEKNDDIQFMLLYYFFIVCLEINNLFKLKFFELVIIL